jgi:transcriptional regulator of heat shock response
MATDQGKELAEEVTAQSADLLVIRDAVNKAYYQNVSFDMADAYRHVKVEGEKSLLTDELEDALRKVQSLIELAKDEQPSDAPATPEDLPAPKADED